jgi:hypothetical protein
MRRKEPPPEFVTFSAEIASLSGKLVPQSMTPGESRTPEELNIRAKTAATDALEEAGARQAKGR